MTVGTLNLLLCRGVLFLERFDSMMCDMLERSQDRVETLFNEHKQRLEQLEEMRGKTLAPPTRKLRHDDTGPES